LIVAPLSLIGQWQSESQTWAPDLNVVFYHGSADAREFLSQQEFYYTDQFTPKQVAAKLKKMHVTKFHTLITTYEVVLKDVEVLKKIRWKALIVDEAHRLKNPKSKLFEELASVPRDFCLLLTGTPLQNSTEELWALLNFADPAVFKSKDEFVEKFGELSDAKQVSELHTVLKPYLLRRVKEDVEKSLPPKEETILEVTLTPIQKTYYKAIYERNTAFLFKGAKPSNAPSLMNVMMELRKVCNHPFLIRGAEERIVADAVSAAKEKDENGNEAMIEPIKIFGEQLIKSSGKFVLMAKLLPKLFAGGHKVLIFSQMVRALDLLEELLKWKKYRYERLDGSTNATSRAAAVERFTRKACKRFVMLLSTRAGGLGLNLTAADTVVIFDSDWNPQNDLQAMARSHRIGQTRPVRVYRLLTAKTYEMHMFHTASMKLGLDRAVLAHQRQQGEDDSDSKGTKKSDREVQAKEIDELLKKGAYDVFRDDDDKEAQKFMETDIDQLLEQSATKVTYGQVTSSLSSGLGSFSKASFVADTGDGGKDVDLDDPDFWAKAIGLDKPEETPEDVAQMIDDGVKRSRRQVQVYDPYAELAEAEQKKKDKIAQRVKEEKEEKERLRLEKKLRKLEEKEKKRKQKEQELVKNFAAPSPTTTPEPEEIKPRDSKPKKLKKSERSKAQRRAEYEDPTYERLKQAWDVPQRNRGSSSLLRFGFGRFCKLRSDSNYTSLALQDMEIFARAYLFQIALQVAVSIMKRLKEQNCASRELSDIIDGEFKSAVGFWLGNNSEAELSWICESVVSALRMHAEVQSYKRFLRMPLCLADDEYVTDLRKGQALRALRRLGILERLNCILTEVIDDIIASLGSDEMGRRGCLVKDYATIDTDLKARHITGEELVVALGARLPSAMKNPRSPAVWWDRSCDLGLLVGSFIHGFGNYEAMRADDELPFLKLIDSCAAKDDGCSEAARFFTISTMVARQVFDEALESSKAKAQLEAHAAVAAVVAATKKAQAERETDGPIKDATLGITEIVNEIDNDSDDLHMVTLPRLNRRMSGALRKALRGEEIEDVEVVYKPGEALPMPDPRVLDARLAELVELMETKSIPSCPVPLPVNPLVSEVSDMASMTMEILAKSSRGLTTKQQLLGREFHGLGLSGNQCGSAHRSLDDGGDYAVSSASTDLNFVATGNEGPRYLRALGVPIYITRYAIVATVNADSKTVQCMLVNERLRNYGTSEEKSGNAVDNENAKNNESAKNSESSIKHDDCKDDATGVPKSIPQIIPHDLIPMLIRDNTKIRASICAIALHYGCPVGRLSGVSISDTIVHALQQYTPYSEAVSSMFTLKDFCARVRFLSGATEMPPEHEVRDYLETILLPHCLRMAVYGNGPTTRHTRVSKGTFETSHGISLYPEPFLPAQTPLPDPCCAASEHSMEAILGAGAILRRVRLVRAAQYAVGGALSFEKLEEIFSSKKIRNSMDHLPIWWNPRIHDLALLVTVASEGVFGVLSRRQGSVFDKNSGVIPEQVKSLSKSLSGSEEDMSEFVKATCAEFPSPRAIERRLALLCSEATKSLDDETCYYHLPMFDHGGWPRN
jgi:chromodomain-helicase-DNA-binding protein 7